MISDEPQEWLKTVAPVFIGKPVLDPARIFGVWNRAGELAGVVLFNDYDERNVEVSVAGVKSIWSRAVLRELGNYAFGTLNVSRVSFTTKYGNWPVRRLIERLGGKFEGIKRQHYSDDDAALYGLLKDEYRFGG